MDHKTTMIRSKIMKPALPRNYLERKRLLDTLSQMEEPLVLISASMGYGKTVVMTHFAKANHCAWYHLDDTDNDLMAFGRYFEGAIAELASGFALDFSRYLSGAMDEGTARRMALDCVEALYQAEAQGLRLVLDDFHVIENELVLLFLTTLVERLDGGLQLYICSKSAMPASFARLVMSQMAVYIPAKELAFTATEIEQLSRSVAPLVAPDELAEQLYGALEGWPAGVMSALLHVRSGGRTLDFDAEAMVDMPYLRDYFMHELFRKLPFDLQQFLTNTAVLEYLQPELCNLLTGRHDGAAQLSYLEQENLFVIRTAGTQRFYRYHGLFRQFLCTLSTPEQQQVQYEKASQYYLASGNHRWAVEAAMLSKRGDLLLQTVEALGDDLVEQGEMDTLRHCLSALDRLGVAPSEKVQALRTWYNQQLSRPAPAPEEPPQVPVTWLQVGCFGKLQVTTGDGVEITWRTRKTKELFACLYHRKGQPVTKEQLMDILWPQATATNATSLFHTSLYNIRKALSPYPAFANLICHSKQGYTMDPALVRGSRWMVDGFDRQGTFPAGVEPEALYPGPYLEDVDGDWCADARAYYSGVFLRAYRAFALEAIERGDHRRAVSFLRTVTAQEPYNEELAGLLIQTYTALGEMKNTMAVYARLKAVLKEDLDVEPGVDVTSVYRQCLLKRLESRRDGQ